MSTDRITEAGNRLKKYLGDNPSKVIIYVATNSTAKSNMSGNYTAFIIQDNTPLYLVCEYRQSGCGTDRTFDLAYNIFCSAYGHNNKDMRYQDKLQRININ